MTDNLLKLGVQAAKAGDYEKARVYFVKVVQTDPTSETGWLFLGHCLNDPEKKKYCYQKVLELNAVSQPARKALAGLNAQSSNQAQTSQVSLQPMSISAAEEKAPTTKKRRSKLPFILIGSMVSLIVCASAFFAFAIFSGLFDQTYFQLPASLLLGPSATPLPTLAPSSTPTGIPTRTPWPTVTPVDTVVPIPSLLSNEFASSNAYTAWDELIAQDPGNADAYYQRAKAYYDSAEQIGSLQVYLLKLDSALDDIDTAISLRSDDGDYYYLRQNIYSAQAFAAEYSVDSIYLNSIALDNANKAAELGTVQERPERLAIGDLIFSNQCEKALRGLQQLIAKVPKGDSALGGLLHLRSQAYACLGRLSEALQSINDSMFNNLNLDYKNTLKVQYLVMLGRYKDALPILNGQICNCPLAGWRYYLRAEIYYNTGKKDLVQNELEEGMPRTWLRGGMLPYVEAQMALDDGRTEDAIRFFQFAEATFDPTYNPLRLKIQKQLVSLGAQPANPTPSIPHKATPIP